MVLKNADVSKNCAVNAGEITFFVPCSIFITNFSMGVIPSLKIPMYNEVNITTLIVIHLKKKVYLRYKTLRPDRI